MGDTVQREWTEAVGRHRAAITDYLRVASSIEEPVWRLPIGPNKWTPAQITDHVFRTYQVAVEQVRGGPGIRVRYGFLLRQILRVLFLPRIFRTRRLPRGAKAPREIFPGDSEILREMALRRLDELSSEFEREILLRRDDRSLRLTHHIFGEIEPLKGVDFIAIHTEHHGRQLSDRGSESAERAAR
ncbi:MAG: DinB family protein [Acidobacteriota bacterium]